ncbi:MAG TPA: GNAT family N-acetyltransferase [Lysobacter sp.]
MSHQIDIRACVAGDEEALALVGQASFLETFAGILDGADILAHCAGQHAGQVYRAWLADERVRMWVAQAKPGDAPVGYLVLAPAALPVAGPRADDLEIKRIYLLHRFQGGGIGKRLMAEAVQEARRRGCGRLLLGVYADNLDAIAFYERCGFSRVGERRFRVGNNEYQDAVLGLDLEVAA